MGGVGSALALGFVLGVQHATDADHLVAVATIVSRERRFRSGAVIGALWGLGHTLSLTAVGGLVLALGVRPGPLVGVGLEMAVAVMLVLLGVVRLREAARGVGSVAPEHLAADHAHGGRELVHSHSHSHVHGAAVHAHPHVHPSRRLLAALAARGAGVGARATLVGVVHGLAGTAVVTLLVLGTLGSGWSAAIYLLAFGVGTTAGMTALTAAMAYPVSLALRVRRVGQALAAGAGLGSIAFGVFYAARLV